MAAYVSVEFSKVTPSSIDRSMFISSVVALDPFVCVLMPTVTYHDNMIIACSLTHTLRSRNRRVLL